MQHRQKRNFSSGIAVQAGTRRQLHILVVDDEAAICKFLEEVLTLHGHSVVTFTSGPEGIAAARTRKFDLVLLDIRMPRMMGPEVLHELRRQLPNAAFVMMTAYADDEPIARSLGEGALLCLHKPISVSQLFELTDGVWLDLLK